MRFGMGIHAGETIVGMMGYGKTVSETAVGDNVNVAARLEELTKSYKCQLVISKYVAEKAKIDIKQFTNDLVKIRGRSEKAGDFVFGECINTDKLRYGGSRSVDIILGSTDPEHVYPKIPMQGGVQSRPVV